jgi:hypothetical protein
VLKKLTVPVDQNQSAGKAESVPVYQNQSAGNPVEDDLKIIVTLCRLIKTKVP